jgi:hypothetical protein
MASIRKETFIDVPSRTAWDALRDVGALHTRLVPGFVTDTKLEPGARLVTFGNGQVLRELIVDLNETDRRLAWAVVDGPSGITTRPHRSSMKDTRAVASSGLRTCCRTSSPAAWPR